MDGLNSRLERAEGKTCKQEGRTIEITQSEQERKETDK